MHFISGYLLFKDFCENVYEEPVPQLKFYEEVSLVAMLALTNTHTHMHVQIWNLLTFQLNVNQS